MYREEIKEILKNTYDVCARTLDFGSSAASRGKKDEYFFYSLDKDDEEEILTLKKKFLRSEIYWNHSFLKLKKVT